MEVIQPPPVLTDGVITLRPQQPSDTQRIYERSIDPLAVKYTTIPSPYTIQDAKDFVALTNSPTWTQMCWAIEVDGQFAGGIDWRPYPGSRGMQGDVGFAMHPDARGKGYLSRALTLMLGLLDDAGVRTVRWHALMGNVGSLKVVWRAGWPVATCVPGLDVQRGVLKDCWIATRKRGETQTMGWDEYLAASMPRAGWAGVERDDWAEAIDTTRK
ncbi:uncharacterized protein EHS24_001631 [Apiotrichum porosum]|uniref:N-acetyltransferase domain-containing protein n=1 Tax=Apiotrichum porosum TaxID=105984 RepID=A0A427XIW5_9TREE|nr:uncharacterized protein EHS24_001631 [Apiotrichum porosum]RSH78732.1 hypothetical protein EHS24_001631 [Apiotrichum porosum]